MISCPNCGLENGDFDELCSGCGTPLGVSPQKNNRKAKRGDKAKTYSFDKKRLWRIAVATVAIAGVGIGGVLVAKGLSAESALKQATRKTAKLFAGSAASEDECVSGGRKIIALLDKGEYTVDMVCENYELTIDTDYNYSRKKRCMSGSAAIIIDEFDFSADYSIDDDLLLVSSPVGMENVYGVDLSDLEKNLRESPLGSILPKEITKLIKVDFFKKIEFRKLIKADENREIQSLVRSTKIKYLDKCVITGVNTSIPCKMYQVSWDKEKVKDVVDSLNKKATINELGAFFANVVLKLEPDVRCYVNDNKVLVGVDTVFAGVRYIFLLEGEQNLWDQFSLPLTTLTGEKKVYTGGVANEGNGTKCCLGDVNSPYLVLSLTQQGDFALETAEKGTILKGNLSDDGDAVNMEITLDLEEVGETHLACRLSALQKNPQPLSGHYIDLLNMKLGEIQRLLFDLGRLG